MLAQEVARRYARALFMSVQEKSLLDQSYEQLSDLKAYLATDSSFMGFLTTPNVPEATKSKLIRDAFGPRMERLLVEFLGVLIEKKRIRHLGEIIDEFVRLVKAEKGIAHVTVISAVPLSNAERERLIPALAEKTNMKIELEQKVDPSIIGGMIILMHNEIIDGSIRHELTLIEEQLSKVRVH